MSRCVLCPVLLTLIIGGCGSENSKQATDSGPTIDASRSDAARTFDPGPEPNESIDPVFGEVTIIQLELPVGLTVRLGEAAIIVGPDGTLVLLDIGNSTHDDEVRDAVRRLNTSVLTEANGYQARTPLQVEWVVITHFHGDHVGAFENLFVDTDEPLNVTRGIVHRGFVDIGEAVNEADYETFCTTLTESLSILNVPLCDADPIAGCDFAALASAHPATGCPGLHLGDLESAADDSQAAPTFLSLGAGASLTLIGADAHVSNGTTSVSAPPFGHSDSNEENARSLVGIVSYGPFRYHFGGDLTGSGDAGEPDIESHLVAVAQNAFYGELGADVSHLHHHARRTSSNSALVDALAPADGRSRNAIAGINAAHIGSPHAETLAAWADNGRLGDGRIWTTRVAATGARHERLVDADGPVILQTIQAGLGYRVQAAGETLESAPFPSVR